MFHKGYKVIYITSYINATLLLRCATTSSRRIIQGLNIGLPLLLVDSLNASVIGHQAVNFALNVGRLGPDTTTARVPTNLILQFAEQDVAAVVPCFDGGVDFVGLVDRVDSSLFMPETGNG